MTPDETAELSVTNDGEGFPDLQVFNAAGKALRDR